MPDFFPLTVSDARRDTRDAVVLTLRPAAADADRFRFEAGQYLTFKATIDGEELRRSYSICSGTSDGTLRVGIKRVDGGRDRKSTRLNSSHSQQSRMPSSA